MVKIVANEGCGNAPKQRYILDFLIAGAEGRIDDVTDMVSDNVHLELIGRKSVDGKEDVHQLIAADSNRAEVTELRVDVIISHGKYCAATGTLHFDDGGCVAFNTMYTFDSFGKNAKIQKISVYSIVL